MKYTINTVHLIMVLLLTVFPCISLAEDKITGEYQLVALRNASDVAHQISTVAPSPSSDSPIGQNIVFESNGIKMPGLGCDKWQTVTLDNSIVNLNDPLLKDLDIPPIDSPLSAGEQRIKKNYSYICEEESFLQVFQLDSRVIVIPWKNSSQYLIAEKILTNEEMTRFQKQLKSMKFYHGAITGELDHLTLDAINAWIHYRSGSDKGYMFKRPIITENLLDALGVLK